MVKWIKTQSMKFVFVRGEATVKRFNDFYCLVVFKLSLYWSFSNILNVFNV